MNEIGVGNHFIWIYAERIIQQILSFIVTLILARLITPEEYGVIALVTIFVTIANVFVEGGFGTALIQKKNAGEVDFSSALYVSLFTSIFLYAVIWFSAPYLQAFFGYENFVEVFRVMGIRILISSFYIVQQAYISRKMKFKLSFVVSLVGFGISSVIAVWMAYRNVGVWALVWQQVGGMVVVTLILTFVLDWRPKLLFSWKSIKEIFKFGSKMLISSLLDTLYNNLRSLVIGKKYNKTDLAYYNKAEQFPSVIVTSINSSIGKLLLPIMSKQQEHKEIVKEYTRVSIKISSFVMSPILVGMAICSRDIITLILTDSWVGAAPMMSILCVMYIFYPIHTANLQAIIAMGKSNIYMVLEIIKKVIGIIFLCVAVFVYDSVIAIVVSGLVVSLIAIIINAAPNIGILGYKIREQLKDIFVSIACAMGMGVLVFLAGNTIENIAMRLFMKVLIGIVSYGTISYFLNKKDFKQIFNLSKKIINKKYELEEKGDD